MYLAPINYDRFFKKVFSDTAISKRFLEDFFDIEIESIEPLKEKHKITDDSSFVEFDFRCKIDGMYVIIDMQQWYKKDIIQRFYLYHSMNTVLQLEKIPSKTVEFTFPKKENVMIKDYRTIEPVITLVWLVDDDLNFTMDSVSYIMSPEVLVEFIQNRELWYDAEILKLLKKREEILQMLSESHETVFLGRNKLIFAMQKNIVKNIESNRGSKYSKWFRFAMKTRNNKNKQEDFEEFRTDEVFQEMIRRLEKKSLTSEEELYISDQENVLKGVEIFTKEIFDKGKIEGEQKKAIEVAKNGIQAGLSNETISQLTGLSIEEIQKLRDGLNP